MGGYVSNLLCTVVGSAYPAYASFKALETPDPGDDTQWLVVVHMTLYLIYIHLTFVGRLTYWVVYAFFTFLENFAVITVLTFIFAFLLTCFCCRMFSLAGSRSITRSSS